VPAPLRGWKLQSERLPDPVDGVGAQRPRTPSRLRDRLRAIDHNTADDQLSKEREPVDIREAERAPDLDVGVAEMVQRGAEEADLALDAVDQARLVAAIDEQNRASRGDRPPTRSS
jgi:hypothetical protein